MKVFDINLQDFDNNSQIEDLNNIQQINFIVNFKKSDVWYKRIQAPYMD